MYYVSIFIQRSEHTVNVLGRGRSRVNRTQYNNNKFIQYYHFYTWCYRLKYYNKRMSLHSSVG